ncbi:ABC transporter, permease protein [Paenibacillus sp. oral taxon 786 str. D14]|uniref:ABC transporter permease n=1 Tax=Paenibacillus sp. oral taxon 786 TaxID=652715 RepID=UPI0001AFDCF4|nr:ABC transporter permease subunit [Paenibacillus sp. oral taxon 786]EES72356.1 ABC transporter, permease protein [Paenibacillus sp. oral taxon 786 str. D14]
MAKKLLRNYQLYLFVLPVVVYYLIFHYYPMYGVQIAFKNFMATEGIWGSPWIGFDHFERFFNSFQFERLILNTIYLNLLQLIVGFPVPIILALMLNQLMNKKFKRFSQTVVYAPHFISTVVMAGIIFLFLSESTGMVNKIIVLLGGEPINFMGEPGWFRPVYVLSDIWQNAGFGTVIYLAALAGVNPELHESAVVDGANKFQRIIHIDIPSIMPTMVILLILSIGNLMSIGFEKVLLLQTSLNQSTSEVIATYVYKNGVLQGQYSFTTAVGLFNSIINFVLLLIVNQAAKKLTNVSLW